MLGWRTTGCGSSIGFSWGNGVMRLSSSMSVVNEVVCMDGVNGVDGGMKRGAGGAT